MEFIVTSHVTTPQINALFRLEPGCLGPNGIDLAYAFCDQIKHDLQSQINNNQVINWRIEPRFDKTLPETEYSFNERPINPSQAKQLAEKLGINLDDIEMNLHDMLAEWIDDFLA
jgi:hypothetical protein